MPDELIKKLLKEGRLRGQKGAFPQAEALLRQAVKVDNPQLELDFNLSEEKG